MTRLDAPPAPGEFQPRPRSSLHRLDEQAEALRAARRDELHAAEKAQRTADERNLLMLRADPRFMRLCRAYSLGDDAQRDELAAAAERILREALDVRAEVL